MGTTITQVHPIDWAIVLAILTAVTHFVVRYLVPAFRNLRQPERFENLGMESLKNFIEANVGQLRDLTLAFQAEIQRQTEWRAEMRALLIQRTPMLAEMASDQRILAEEMTKVAVAMTELKLQVTELEKRSRGQEEAIHKILNRRRA